MATTTKGRRKQSYPSKAPASPDIVASYQHEHNNEEQAHDFTTWSNKIKNKVLLLGEQQTTTNRCGSYDVDHLLALF